MALPSSWVLSLALLLLHHPALLGAKRPFALPYRGWTSWDLSAVKDSPLYGREFLTEAAVLAQSDALAASPLQRVWDGASPRTVLAVDSFWAADPTKVVDAHGRWAFNETRFPSGPAAIAARARANGQRLGLYLNPGVPVAAVAAASPVLGGGGCTARDIAWGNGSAPGNTFYDTRRINFTHPCAQTYVDSVVAQLVGWGVGFLKLDAVSPGSGDTSGIDNRADVAAFSGAISRAGADLWLTISWHIDPRFAADFAPHANAWRTSDDVDCYCEVLSAWHAVRARFTEAVPWLVYLPGAAGGAAAGGFPDLDTLNVLQGAFDGLTDDEKLSSATLWALVGAPLYTGNDLTAAGGATAGLELLTNPEVLAVNDAAAPPSLTPASAGGTADLQTWFAPGAAASGGGIVVALFNLGEASTDVALEFADVGLTAGATACVRDLWLRADLGCLNGSYAARGLPSHGARLLRLTAPAATVQPLLLMSPPLPPPPPSTAGALNCTAMGEALCTADGACAAFGVDGDQIQLHGCVALVPNPDWSIFNRTADGGYTRLPGAVNINEDACSKHPNTGMSHACVPPPSPPLYERQGSIDVGTYESTIFYWPATRLLYLIENIPCSYIDHAGIWAPETWGNRSYGRIREFVSGRVVANITSSAGFGFMSAFVDYEHGHAWLFGTPSNRCEGNGAATTVQAWWSSDLLSWSTALAFDYGKVTYNVQVTKVGPMGGASPAARADWAARRAAAPAPLPPHRYAMFLECFAWAINDAADGNLTAGWTLLSGTSAPAGAPCGGPSMVYSPSDLHYYILTGGAVVRLYRSTDFAAWTESSPSPFIAPAEGDAAVAPYADFAAQASTRKGSPPNYNNHVGLAEPFPHLPFAPYWSGANWTAWVHNSNDADVCCMHADVPDAYVIWGASTQGGAPDPPLDGSDAGTNAVGVAAGLPLDAMLAAYFVNATVVGG